MCGRFVVSYTYQDLLNFMSNTFDIFDLDPTIESPRYNIAPGTNVLSIISDGDKYRAGNLKWGFIPSFAKTKNSAYKMINARIEGIEDKASFKESFYNKRCVIVADGYYEWKKVGKSKYPFLIQKEDKKLFFFAGLWSKYIDDQNETVYTTTIITREASENVSDIHDRMPVIFDEETAKLWLDNESKDKEVLLGILGNSITNSIQSMRVSEYVNNVRNTSEKCIEEFTENRLF